MATAMARHAVCSWPRPSQGTAQQPALQRQQPATRCTRVARHDRTAVCTRASRPGATSLDDAQVLAAGGESEQDGAFGVTGRRGDDLDVPRVCVVVSRDSGPQRGAAFAQQLRAALPHLGARAVLEVPDGASSGGLTQLTQLVMGEAVCPRIVIAGGDGTVSWVVDEVTAALAGRQQTPSFSILPYGTGNDLARALGCLDHDSSAATPQEALALLRRLERAPLRSVDRWQLRVSSVHSAPRVVRWNNYLSIGFDAGVALAFDAARRSAPSALFSTRLGNKAAYGLLGALDFAMGSCRELAERVSLQCDGREVPLPAGTCGLLLLNISSFMGGVTPWAADTASCPGDGLLEVVAHRGALHLAAMQLGLEAGIPLGRAARVVVTTTAPFPAQADGEPWMQAAASVLEVSRHGTTQFAVPGMPALAK